MASTKAVSIVLVAGLCMGSIAEAGTDSAVHLQASAVAAVLPTSLMLAATPEQIGVAAKALEEPDASSPLTVRVTGFGQMGARSDGKDNNGSLGVSQVGGVVGLAYRIDDTYTLTLNLRSTRSYFSFSDEVRIAGIRKPFNDLNEFGIDPGLLVRFDENWTGFFTARLRWGGEPQNAFSDGFEGGAVVGASYRFSPDLTVGFGVGVLSRIEQSAQVIPIIAVNWKASETVRVRNRRLGVEVVVDVAKDLQVIVGGEYEFEAYRLDESSPIRRGVVRDRHASIDIGLAYTICPNIVASVSGGATIHRSIKLLNSDGQELDRFEADPAPYIGARLEVKF